MFLEMLVVICWLMMFLKDRFLCKGVKCRQFIALYFSDSCDMVLEALSLVKISPFGHWYGLIL